MLFREANKMKPSTEKHRRHTHEVKARLRKRVGQLTNNPDWRRGNEKIAREGQKKIVMWRILGKYIRSRRPHRRAGLEIDGVQPKPVFITYRDDRLFKKSSLEEGCYESNNGHTRFAQLAVGAG